jgi:hypothetical protein
MVLLVRHLTGEGGREGGREREREGGKEGEEESDQTAAPLFNMETGTSTTASCFMADNTHVQYNKSWKKSDTPFHVNNAP